MSANDGTGKLTRRDICVVIPVLNEAARVRFAIESVQGVGQIIVVDGGSSDDTVLIASSFPDVDVMHSEPGRGLQLKTGAAVCTRRIVWFLHGDCHVCSTAPDAVANAVNRGQAWGTLTQQIDAPQRKYRWLEFGNAARVRCFGMAFGDQAIFVDFRLYQSVGGFEPVSLMEDVRLSKSLRRIQWPVLIQAKVIVDPRRWQRRGVLRQTWLNWKLQLLHQLGTSPDQLEKQYRK